MPAPDRIKRLIEVFERNLPAYKNSGYKEAQLRSEFIEPFFEELGWDVRNKQGWAEAYKDVITEDAIKVGGYTKAPDYCFRIGGSRKFFLEAKKPSVDIKEGVDPAYQLRRYAWSADLPLSILTDFEEFAVYNCRVRPQHKDKSGKDRVMYLTYKEYAEKWDEIAAVFSRKAVMEGLFDKYAESVIGRRTTQEVDVEFLKEIETWRTLLAKNIAIRNPSLAIRELNYAVEKTIDRIIFLRICEDRGIEQYGQLQALLNGQNSYRRLAEIYQKADEKYNSGLFHFREEKEMVTPPDLLTPRIKIDDQALKEILKNLYYPESPYEFSVLGVDILGNIYEQFLGKVIRLTAGHHAVVEEKPEVRKAGGVYYTPTYIVDYIVKNTVGKLCEEKTPKQIEKLKILDPACGSGSFLIGAYAYLLNYHRDWYVKYLLPQRGFEGVISKAALRKLVPGEKPEMPIYQGRGGQWYLSTREKKRILLNNIHGVDIDRQAVEVTKLSLLLKVLENENQDTLDRQMKLWRERALPDLGNNIKCGNSLIGPDIYEMDLETARKGRSSGQRLPGMGAQFTGEEQDNINAFDWNTEFHEIMRSGGFDAVIGNPPYDVISAKEQNRRESEVENEKLYYKARDRFEAAYGDKLNYYRLFIAQSLALMKRGGYHGFIVPMGFLADAYAKSLRVSILAKLNFTIIDVFPQKDDPNKRVFRHAKLPTCIYVLNYSNSHDDSAIFTMRIHPAKDIDITSPSVNMSPKMAKLLSPVMLCLPVKQRCTNSDIRLAAKLGETCTLLSNYASSKQGEVNVTADKEFVRWYKTQQDSIPRAFNEILRGAYIDRYRIHTPKQGGYYYLNAKAFIESHRRDNTKAMDHEYARIGYQRGAALDNWRRIIATKIPIGSYCADTINYIVNPRIVSLEYLLGLLNSSLLEWRFRLTSATNHVNSYEIDCLPVPKLDMANAIDKIRHDKIAEYVKRILELNDAIVKAKTPEDKTHLDRQIKVIDDQIDRLVYELYGLTEEEIRIVKEGI